MKLSAIFLFAVSLHVAARSDGQSVTLDLRNVPMQKVFKQVSRQTGISILYNEALFSGLPPVTIKVKDATIQQVLDECLKDRPFTYSVEGNLIHISKKSAAISDAVNRNNEIAPPADDIHGRVTDSLGNPLAGASVTVKGAKKGVGTDANGNFDLRGVDGQAPLLISFTGFIPREYTLSERNSFVIVLSRSNNPLDEIQVIAYGTITKRLNTGDVTTVTSKELETQPTGNIMLTLEGRVPGMYIRQGSGLPGSGVSVQLRGQNSLANGNDPLYIVDGVPYASKIVSTINGVVGGVNGAIGSSSTYAASPFSYLNPADIESVDILKDADATAIYGSRGANGVVLITTKKGRAGKIALDVNLQSGFGKVFEKLQLLNTRQYLDMRHEAFRNDHASVNPTNDYDLALWDTTRNTDWQKELIGRSAAYHDAELSFSGGNSNTQFFIGAGYHKETTVFPGDFNDRKGSVHFSINSTSPNQKLKLLFSGLYTLDNNYVPGNDLTPISLTLPPDAPAMYKRDGSLNWEPTVGGGSSWPTRNPAATELMAVQTKTNNLVSNFSISYNIARNLEIKSSFGYTNTLTNENMRVPLVVYDPATWSSNQRSSVFNNTGTQTWIIEPQITYKRGILGGTLTALAGATIEQNNSNGRVITAFGFSSDLLLKDPAAATAFQVSGKEATYKYNAVFGRINYNWQNKYLLNLTLRRDGSSRFGPANQFHDFGSAGLGWIFSNEDFFQKYLTFLSYGKLRASYGSTGSDQVGDYKFMDLYVPLAVAVPYQSAIGNFPNGIFVPDLSWEETGKMESTVELGFLKNRFFFTLSYYRNRSTNQLVAYSLPSITGFTTVARNLGALVQNKGWEFEFKTVNTKSKKFQWTSSFNITVNRNKLISGAPGLSDYFAAKIGHPLLSTAVYHFLGVNPVTGLYQFADSHGNPTSNPNPSTDQMTWVDLTPEFYGGLQNSITYKDFQLDFLFQFENRPMTPNYLSYSLPGLFGFNQPINVLNRWQNPGDVKPVQRFSQNLSTLTAGVFAQASDQIFSDGSYIRLKNVSLSWHLPKGWLQKLQIQEARFYIHIQNALTITGYKGLDPETASVSTPPLRVISFGVQSKF